MVKRILIPILLAAFLVGGCASVKTAENAGNGRADVYEGAPGAPEEAPSVEFSKGAVTNLDQSALPQSIERMVIRNANLSIVVNDPAVVMDDIARMSNSMDGYVVNSNLYQVQTGTGLEVPEANITIRVPAELLDEALTQVKAHVDDPDNDILYENVSGQDVTQEYTDLRSRLRNLEDAAEQLRSIMDDATKTEDVLKVFNELKSYNEQIEVLKGQIQYYEQSAKLSAITVGIKAKESVQPISVGGWEPKGVAKDAVESLIRAYQTIADAVIWIVIFCLPIALPIGVVLYFVIRGIIKWNRKQKAKKAANAAEVKE